MFNPVVFTTTRITVIVLLLLYNERVTTQPPPAGPMINIETIIQGLVTAQKLKNVYDLIKKYPPTFVEYLYRTYSKPTDDSPAYPNVLSHSENQSAYDFVVDFTRPTDILTELKAYPLTFPGGKENYDEKVKETFSRFVVNVVGRYNVGKTYILRLLAGINLGHSFIERTNGISVSLPQIKDLPLALIDTAGTRTPVEFEHSTFQQSSYERQVSDSFIQEIALNSAEIFVFVVNQLTLDDQLYLKTLFKRLQERGYAEKEIKQKLLIVHNYFNLQTLQEIESVEEAELKGLFRAEKQPQGYWLSEYFKHFVFADDKSEDGSFYNQRSVQHVRNMIKGSSNAQEKDVLRKILNETEKILSKFLIEEPFAAFSGAQKADSSSSTGNEGLRGKISDWISGKADEEPNQKSWNERNWVSIVLGSSGSVSYNYKQLINVELEVRQLSMNNRVQPIYFIAPKKPLADNVILSKNLRFQEDGSIYLDFSSSDYIPDMQTATINERGDLQIKIECPSCSPNFQIQPRGSSITIRAVKDLREAPVKTYFNTRRSGYFEVTIPVGQYDPEHTFDFSKIQKKFENGIIIVTIPRMMLKKEF